MKQIRAFILFGLLFQLISFTSVAQSAKQKQLEAKRQQLQKEIKEMNSLLFTDKKKEKSVLTQVEDLNRKITVMQNLIRVTNDQANLLTREINDNQKQIGNLRKQLEELKEAYAAMIVTSYKNKSQQSRVMFLLSSENFKQAYKRLQYFKQYREYQQEQAAEIKNKTEKLQELNTSLLEQKKQKDVLVAENRESKKQLEVELAAHETLMASIRKNMASYAAQIKKKQQEADRIDREIERLIKEAIAESNKSAGKSSSSETFALTAEAKKLAANFEANRGKLPWPVEKGVVQLGYGQQPSPIDKKVPIMSHGVRIATSSGTKARAVFDGVVKAISVPRKGNPVVLIQHGNYFTVYSNLSKVYVKKGDKVTTKQEIGEVFTDVIAKQTILSFSVWKNTKTENPALWLYNM
ncbi:murein hydrolase activator EnvC family protein [Aegicerativicinus sediminis]|uniref:murein hydrolase activator EnvC family protein n=1 Tax=Aegicerativicinus sediminis TaxID=2893202 RepID=UPI001E5D17EB|nr:peptidoglycan DD-metalloendopeptidase family protein [Aegicerativicinus sediminis]